MLIMSRKSKLSISRLNKNIRIILKLSMVNYYFNNIILELDYIPVTKLEKYIEFAFFFFYLN